MNFFTNLRDSIYAPEFYRSLPGRSFSTSLVYYLLLSLAFSVLLILSFLPKVASLPRTLHQGAIDISKQYPRELTITIKNGVVSTNVKEPYKVTLPGAAKTDSGMPTNLVVIDTKTPFSANQFRQYDTSAWLTKDTLFYKGSEDRADIRAFDLTKVKDFTLNRSVIEEFITTYSPYLRFVIPVVVALILIGLFLLSLVRLLYFLFLALLVMLLVKLFKQNLTYANAYKMTLHAVTLAIIVETVLALLSPFTNFHGFSFMFTLITLAVVAVNFAKAGSPALVKTPRTKKSK